MTLAQFDGVTVTADPTRNSIERLKRLLTPNSIAFIGGRHVELPIRLCRDIGFQGPIWPSHPKLVTIGGESCLPSLDDLPEVPDAAFVALSPERSIAMVQKLASLGVAGAVCMANGFAEMGGPGIKRQEALRAAAGDMVLIGPNCMGFLN